jgi:dephospho-CoA kinase
MILGLTGGIASGKSESAMYFEALGAYSIDADKISREVVAAGMPALDELVKSLGCSILDSSGNLDRKKLAEMIFSDKKIKCRAEEILHAYIIPRIDGEVSQRRADSGIVIIDAPLLFETGLDRICDKIVVVWIPYDVQVRRLALRDKLDSGQIKKRIDSQMSMEKKVELADFVIDNSGSKRDLKKNVEGLYKLLTSERK